MHSQQLIMKNRKGIHGESVGYIQFPQDWFQWRALLEIAQNF
jgi:hypothetical protein